MKFRYGKKHFLLTPGTIIFAKMSVDHEFTGFPDCGWEGYYIHAMVPQIYYEFSQYFDTMMDSYSPKVMKTELESMLKEAEKKNDTGDYDSIMFAHHIQNFLIDFVSQYRNLAANLKIKNLTMMIKSNLGMPINKIANKYGYSTEHFIRKFKDKIGITPKAYMNEVMIENSRQLILNTNAPLKDIVRQCGFKNFRNFYYVFKKNCGVSPQNMRKRKSELIKMNYIGI